MLKNGLGKIHPDHRDYSLLHTYGALAPDPSTLPDYSIYGGQIIPNQNIPDTRFTPALEPLEFGCTGETGSFESGLQDGVLYSPLDLYINTPPGTEDTGRDMRAMLQVLIDRGPRRGDGTAGPKRTAYFNVYAAGNIDSFDAARIALWINQAEKRGVYVGSWFYPEFVFPIAGSGGNNAHPNASGIVPMPASFSTSIASLHAWLITGEVTINGVKYLEALTWQGEEGGFKGVEYFSREIFNALLAQPYTGAFTISKLAAPGPVPLGVQVYIDQLVAFIRSLWGFGGIKPSWLASLLGIIGGILKAMENADHIVPAPTTPQTPVPVQPSPVVPHTQPATPRPDMLSTFCLAIQGREGYYPPGALKGYPEGTPAYINKNPGNLRCDPNNKAGWEHRATGENNGFCVFPDYDTGLTALKEVVEAVCLGESAVYTSEGRRMGFLTPSETCAELTIDQYFLIRDPASDNNDPGSFAAEVAEKCGVPVETQMHDMLT